MKIKRRMTAAEFDAVKPWLKISEDRIAAAKAYLVEGKTLQVIATAYGCTRQAVNGAVTIVWQALSNYRESQQAMANAEALLSPGWEKVTLIAPSHLVVKFRAEIAEALIMEAPTGNKKARPR